MNRHPSPALQYVHYESLSMSLEVNNRAARNYAQLAEALAFHEEASGRGEAFWREVDEITEANGQ